MNTSFPLVCFLLLLYFSVHQRPLLLSDRIALRAMLVQNTNTFIQCTHGMDHWLTVRYLQLYVY